MGYKDDDVSMLTIGSDQMDSIEDIKLALQQNQIKLRKAQENYFMLKAIEELKIQREQESLADKSTVTISRKIRK